MTPRLRYYIEGLSTIGCTPQSIEMITGVPQDTVAAVVSSMGPRSTESPRKNPLPAGGYAGFRGGKVWTRKSSLTEDSVREIRRLRSEYGVDSATLAEQFGVTPRAINKIITRSNWKHVV